ncbi:TPA: glycoside hydrolase family 32 protein [Streptococcus suis]|uniref:glycoside hydrolase family 32 protein n=1 Tax=Streptococcus suis TaxID=1307 RepID=UPI0028B129CB|nr:glycoside hydrolase family 32 protein [Streptococcus suis]WNN11738.1 glycoside hydrolase family 32 protein [Streptococcus suis]HEL9639159.1 glycoside hydrolase family 32 protein [Streptococcus suis]HEM3991705.1 glycoside hydrolase family 32 protein [Streptococcus suis]HEM3997375.1 glycoside hydrolase family 32 protein [Streptococcus suis]HEM3999298.1 glycoside hydrolase family 32 protein [Streptococcus suis]
MKTVEKANAYIQAEKVTLDPTFRPERHFVPEIGWINDPNGFVYFKGEYHLFYQFNPYESVWGPMHWGHAKSKDLVNWEHLPVALAPDKDYDKDGCFSGSAIVKEDTLWLMYTGNIVNEDGSVRQVQNMAYSTDGIHFEKIAQNPVATEELLPEEVIANDFRDPKIFEKDGRYYSVVATKHKDGVGCIVLLGSDDLLDWQFESIFLKGQAHQGHVWECPDYFEVDGQEYLIVSPMRYQKEDNDFVNINSNIFVTGHVDWDKKVFVADSFKEIDHGHDFYAAQTTEGPEGERVMIAWMHTWGRPLVTNDLGHKWYGQMTLPRLLKQGENGLRQVLQAGILNSFDDIEIGEVIQGPSKLSLKLDDSLDLKLGTDQDYLQFGYDKERQEVYIDRSSLKIQQVGEEEWSTVRRAVTVQATELEVLVDTNCLEIFINDGQETLTSTFYVEGQIILNAL